MINREGEKREMSEGPGIKRTSNGVAEASSSFTTNRVHYLLGGDYSMKD